MKHTHLTLIAAAITTTLASAADADLSPANQTNSGAHLIKVANSDDSSQLVKDAYLQGKVVGALAVNPHVSVFDFDVKVYSGVVSLGGTVDTEVERDLAIEIARGVEEINGVRSDITVKAGTRVAREESMRRSLGQKLDDAGTTTSVKTKLLANRSTGGLAINVTTRNGVVTLNGKAKSGAEKDLAERIAENTSGVLEVRNELIVAMR
jgi:osmotically-inducible protein OsmY